MSASGFEPKPVYVVSGADEFRRSETVQQILHALEAHAGADSPSRLDGDSCELAAVLDEVRTYSLLGGRRVVVVENADSFITANRAALENYASAPADSGTLILECRTLAANTRLYKIVSKVGKVVRCDPLKGRDVIDWLIKRATTQHGKRLDDRAAWLLKDLVGDSLGELDAEVSKLAIYVGDRPAVVSADVEALVGNNREQNVFGVIDAMASGDTPTALHQWERVLATDRAAPGRAIGGLAWGIRRLMEIKEEADRGAPLNVLARKAFTRPDVLQRRLSMVTLQELREQLTDLLEADVATKTGLGTVPTAIERFIIKHSAGKAMAARRS